MSDVFAKFLAIDDVMRQAKEIISKFAGGVGGKEAKQKIKKLTSLLNVLKEVFDMLKGAKEWLNEHGKNSVKIEDFTLSVSTLLSKPISLLFAVSIVYFDTSMVR